MLYSVMLCFRVIIHNINNGGIARQRKVKMCKHYDENSIPLPDAHDKNMKSTRFVLHSPNHHQ